MKKKGLGLLNLVVLSTFAVCGLVGCSTTEIESDGNGGYRIKARTSWIDREIKRLSGKVMEHGKFEFELEGVTSDVSEQLPAFTREMWQGIALGLRMGLTAVQPAVATVPLTQDGADANALSQAVTAHGAAKAQVIEAKAKLVEAKGDADESGCSDGSCPYQ
jgi:hypothetical protein